MEFEQTFRFLDEGDSDALAMEIARLSEIVAEGETAKTARADLIRRAHGRDPQRWTQTWLAQQAGISQAAVSKMLRTPGERNLEEETDPAYVVGRLLGVANHMALGGRHRTPQHLGQLTDKLFEEKMPINPGTLGQLRLLIDKQMRGPLSDLFHTVYQAVLDDIDGRLTGLPTLGPGTQTRLSLILGFDHQRAALHRAGDSRKG